MSNILTVPYTELPSISPNRGVMYSPRLPTINVLALIDNKILRFECFAGFSERMNEMGIGLLGRHGFFELFDEITFDQRNKMFKLYLTASQIVIS